LHLNEISNVVVEWGALNGDRDRDSDCIHYTHICMYALSKSWSMVHGPWSTFDTEISDRCECIKFGCFREWWGWRWWKMELLGSDTEWECELHSHWMLLPETKSFRLSLQVSLNVWVAYKENMGKELWRRTLWGGHWKKDGNSSK